MSFLTDQAELAALLHCANVLEEYGFELAASKLTNEYRDKMQLSKPDYHSMIGEAGQEAGKSDYGWNLRYANALAKRGLILSPRCKPDPRYPQGMPFNAPVCYGPWFPAWPKATYVVFADTLKEADDSHQG